jgi:hypothetical protein
MGLVGVALPVVLGVAFVPAMSSAAWAAQNEGQGQQNYPQQGGQGQQGAPEPQSPSPDQTTTQVTNATLKVEKVDKANHIVTFDDPRGGTFDVKAGPDINLEKVKAGEMLDVTYYQETAVAVTKQGQQAPMMKQTTTNRGGVTARQTTITAQVVSIDHENNVVRVKGPGGQMHTLEVTDPGMQARLKDLKAGDNVTISYTQAVALTAQPHTS